MEEEESSLGVTLMVQCSGLEEVLTTSPYNSLASTSHVDKN